MPVNYPKLAGDVSESFGAPSVLFIGEAPIVTDSAPALADITKWQLLKITPTGVTPYTDADTAASLNTVPGQGIAISQIAVASGKQCPYYTSGKFDHNSISWPAELDTYAKRKAFVANGPIQIGHAKPPSA